MKPHYINTMGVRGMARGGILFNLEDIRAVGDYYPPSTDDSGGFRVYLTDGTWIDVRFDSAMPHHRCLSEHGNIVNEYLKLNGHDVLEFQADEKTDYDCTDPDGVNLTMARALGSLTSWLMADSEDDKHKEAAKLVEEFADLLMGDSVAMGEFIKAREESEFFYNKDKDVMSVMVSGERLRRPLESV